MAYALAPGALPASREEWGAADRCGRWPSLRRSSPLGGRLKPGGEAAVFAPPTLE